MPDPYDFEHMIANWMTNAEMSAESGLTENSVRKRVKRIREHHQNCSRRALPQRRDLVLYLRELLGM